MLEESCVVSRKQSASDLQSRLKTRKLLGVGELAKDNGEIYRSKISQLLGINESLYVRFPKGLLVWNSAISLYFYIIGFLCLIVPSIGFKLDYGVTFSTTECNFCIRLYGAALLSFGLLFRSILLQRENRSEIATLLLAVGLLNFLQLLVSSISGSSSFHTSIRTVAVVGNFSYHYFLDGQGGIFRKILRYCEEYSILSTSPTTREPPDEGKDKNA
ncbi:unnamed protein product, partial [Mesorhabditis belari]|uniref:Tumor protein p53-inducible protein 11 n=1 Tax=Mesorhabditis belari TaxID=2138241 RepID=A0AAF3FAX3_9BILA